MVLVLRHRLVVVNVQYGSHYFVFLQLLSKSGENKEDVRRGHGNA